MRDALHRDELVRVVQRLIDADFDKEADADAALAWFESQVPRPEAGSLIFYWDEFFEQEPTAVQIVDKALDYRAIEL